MPLIQELQGPFVEIRCRVPIHVVRQRYRDRVRDPRHLDDRRTEDELWGRQVAPLGVGPLLEVDTARPVDIGGLVDQVRFHLESADTDRRQR